VTSPGAHRVRYEGGGAVSNQIVFEVRAAAK
jgi:hypothetical protein